ncbi:hypothetical protein [Aquipuribacter sp. MA13-6]|uniref:FliH/SctL family protein n=1 Tax=unclassified Aquipuribacter TaxID=2635084 RepID=UPI003EE83F03
MSSSPELLARREPGVPQVRPFVPGVVPGPTGTAGPGRADGYAAGYATGYSEGLRRATATVGAQEEARLAALAAERDQVRTRLGDLMLQLRAGAVQLQEDATVEVADLVEVVATCAADLARQVVLDAAPTADALVGRLRRALDEAEPGAPTTVHVMPDAVRLLEREGVLPDGLPTGVVVVADVRLSDGDVVVRTGATTVTDLLVPAVEAAVAAMTEVER